jgi:glycosyltransferase involved in cell wall biosynthesis
MANLRLNQRRGIFACTSHATRAHLLKVVPHVEKRAVVIPDVVSQEYFEEKADAKYISSIIRNHISTITEPKFLTTREKERFYSTHLGGKSIRFLLMVSTFEPRKNHLKLISAWDYLVLHGATDLRLVIVGTMGWDHTAITQTMAPHQEQGKIFHLQGVPSGQLRLLYQAADAVVCPSVEEGFDLTGIEAMLCGGAVVASDIPVHREIYGKACEFFNPYSMMSQAKAIASVIAPEHCRRREELVQEGLRHATQYRSDAIKPFWANLFERIAGGDFKK